MKITKKITINKSIDTVWKVWAEEFDKAGDWMAQVDHTIQKATGTKTKDAPMIGRVCNFTPNPDGPKAIEDITLYDQTNYKMNLEVVPKNVPIPLKRNLFSSHLHKIANNKTEIVLDADIQLTWKGYLLYPLIKKGFTKSYNELLEELKYYIEKGEVHPRKKQKLTQNKK